MKDYLIELFKKINLSVGQFDRERYEDRIRYFRHKTIYEKYKDFTMIPFLSYLDNLAIAANMRDISGDIVECGVWRGGMIAGISEIIGKNRTYWLYDSFEGLPPAGSNDGEGAKKWQADKKSPHYFNNCEAEEKFALQALKQAGDPPHRLVRGWFNETVPVAEVKNIALLRLDGDWYESTMTCLEALYPKVVTGGVIIIDDYYFWEGCSKAIHDYLSRHKLGDRIEQTKNGVAFIVKDKKINGFA